MRIAGTLRAGGYYQPELVVLLETGSMRIPMTAIVDSGADVTMLPAEDLEPYGIAWEDLPEPIGGGKGQGISDECAFRYHVLHGHLSWRGEGFANDVFIVEPGKSDFGLLGREDFFKTFNVGFEGWRETLPWMDIEPYPRGLQLVTSENPTEPSPPS